MDKNVRKFAAHLETLDLTDEKNLWLYMLTHVAEISKEEVRKMSPIFQRFYNECLISNLTDMEKKIYVRDVLEYADVKESLMCERKYGRELGLEEGLQQGLQQGLEQGEANAKRLLACNMLAKGLDPSLVSEISGLSEEEVLALVQRQCGGK